MFEHIDRRRVKAESRAILRDAQVSPKAFFALYLGAVLLREVCGYLASAAGDGQQLFSGPAELFITIFSNLLSPILGVGIYLYCMAIRRGERAEFLTLFDGFSFVGKIIALNIVMYALIFLWSMLFVIPGIVAAYRYRFALYNLMENPELLKKARAEFEAATAEGYDCPIGKEVKPTAG